MKLLLTSPNLRIAVSGNSSEVHFISRLLKSILPLLADN